jgi:hypothetical protein
MINMNLNWILQVQQRPPRTNTGGGNTGQILGMDPYLVMGVLVLAVLAVCILLGFYMYKTMMGTGRGIFVAINPRTGQADIIRRKLGEHGATVTIEGSEKEVPLKEKAALWLRSGPVLWGKGPLWIFDSVTGLPYIHKPTDPPERVNLEWIDGRDLAPNAYHKMARELNEVEEGGLAGFLNRNIGILALLIIFFLAGVAALLVYILSVLS